MLVIRTATFDMLKERLTVMCLLGFTLERLIIGLKMVLGYFLSPFSLDASGESTLVINKSIKKIREHKNVEN